MPGARRVRQESSAAEGRTWSMTITMTLCTGQAERLLRLAGTVVRSQSHVACWPVTSRHMPHATAPSAAVTNPGRCRRWSGCTRTGHDPSALQRTSDGYYVTLVTGSGSGEAFGLKYLDPSNYSAGWRQGAPDVRY